jgi:crossover junction endodeoxyribonuclease RuvC
MLILGLDPALTQTGYAILDKDHYVNGGVIETISSDTMSERLFMIYDQLCRIMKEYLPNVVAVEHVFVNSNYESSLKLSMARGVIMMVPKIFDVNVFEYTPTHVKKSIVGKGRADKIQLRTFLPYMVNNMPENLNLNTSDAVAIALCHYHLQMHTYK